MSQDTALSAGSRKRDVAHKILIGTVLQAAYVRPEDGQNYIEVDGNPVGRVNIIGAVVSKDEGDIRSFLLDDTSGLIRVTVFDDSMYNRLTIGSVALVIGRVREYGTEKYVSAEIARVIPTMWAKVRSEELAGLAVEGPRQIIKEKAPVGSDHLSEMYELVKRLDTGTGALTEKVIEESQHDKPDELLHKLLQAGDVFEISPGRVKALE